MQYRWLSAFLIMPMVLALWGYLLRDEGKLLQERGMLLSTEQIMAQVRADMGASTLLPVDTKVVLARQDKNWVFTVSLPARETYRLDARYGTILQHSRR